METRNLTQLKPTDFRNHPLWMPTEDLYNEDAVSPCDSCDPIPLEGVFYVSAQFRFADQSAFSGFIRLSEGETMAIAIAINEAEFVFYSLSEAIREALGDTQSAFARKVGKEPQQVFPLEYVSPFRFSDGVPIEGNVG